MGVHVFVYYLLHVVGKLQATNNTTIIICKSVVNGSCIIFCITIIEFNLISYPRGTAIASHHHDAYISLIPWLKSLSSSNGARAIVGRSNCAKEPILLTLL
jgi:hypothetical protein